MKYSNDPKEIIRKLTESRALLFSLFESIPESKWYEKSLYDGKWSVNDILLHIVGWDIESLRVAKNYISHSEPKLLEIDQDEYNEIFLKNHYTKNKEDGIKMLRESTKDIFDFLNGIDEETTKYAIKNKSLEDLDLYTHDIEHYEYIKKVLK